MQFQCIIAQSPQAFYENRTEAVRLPCRGCTILFGNISTENPKFAAMPVLGLCNARTICLRATGLRFFSQKSVYNFIFYKFVEATEPMNPYDIARLWPLPHGNRTIMDLRAVYGRRRDIIGQM